MNQQSSFVVVWDVLPGTCNSMSTIVETRSAGNFAEKVSPSHTAMLIIDMQNDFCAEGGYIQGVLGKDVSAATPVAANIQTLLDSARQSKMKVIWVRADYHPDRIPASMNSKFRQNSSSDSILCEPETWGADFFKLSPAENETVITKHCYSAFFNTELVDVLKKHNISTIIPTGVVTNVCIDSTVRDGFMNGFDVVVAEECVGSHAQELHAATLKNISMIFGTVCKLSELISVLKN